MADHDELDEAWPPVVGRFRDMGAIPDGAVPVASLTLLWYVEPDGTDGM